MGAIRYSSAGEINPVLTMEWNQFQDNGVHLYGNFSTSQAAIVMDVQNMETLLFRVSHIIPHHIHKTSWEIIS